MLIPALLLGSTFGGLTGLRLAQPIADTLTGLISIPFILHFLYATPNTDKSAQLAEKERAAE